MKRILVALVIIGQAFALPALAQKPAVMVSDKPGWHKIGEVTADFKAEQDEIAVLGADRFKSIKLKVKDAPLNLLRMEVFYEPEGSETIAVQKNLKAGEETHVVNLKWADRDLKKVSFTYKSFPNSADEKAEVELYGLK